VIKRQKIYINNINFFFISCITIGELYYGAFKSSDKDVNINNIDVLVSKNKIINCNSEIAKEYGKIKYELKLKGNLYLIMICG